MTKQAKLTFRSNVDKTRYRKAARIARKGIGKVFPRGFRDIEIKVNRRTGSHAYTTQTDTTGRMKISFNPLKHKSSSRDRFIGKLAQTFSHEMFLHARRDQLANSLGQETTNAREDHGRMHDPDHRGEFLQASRNTFKALDNATQKRAFAESFAKDVVNELSGQGLSSIEKRERKGWARARRDSMIHALDNPGDHDWT